jgi:hypothetical protein
LLYAGHQSLARLIQEAIPFPINRSVAAAKSPVSAPPASSSHPTPSSASASAARLAIVAADAPLTAAEGADLVNACSLLDAAVAAGAADAAVAAPEASASALGPCGNCGETVVASLDAGMTGTSGGPVAYAGKHPGSAVAFSR